VHNGISGDSATALEPHLAPVLPSAGPRRLPRHRRLRALDPRRKPRPLARRRAARRGGDAGRRRPRPRLPRRSDLLRGARHGEKGQAAVAHVVLNRAEHPEFPGDVCGVIADRCQFSYRCNGRPNALSNAQARAEATRIATSVLSGAPDPTGGALFFHSSQASRDRLVPEPPARRPVRRQRLLPLGRGPSPRRSRSRSGHGWRPRRRPPRSRRSSPSTALEALRARRARAAAGNAARGPRRRAGCT
jgi:hypothetical protein